MIQVELDRHWETLCQFYHTKQEDPNGYSMEDVLSVTEILRKSSSINGTNITFEMYEVFNHLLDSLEQGTSFFLVQEYLTHDMGSLTPSKRETLYLKVIDRLKQLRIKLDRPDLFPKTVFPLDSVENVRQTVNYLYVMTRLSGREDCYSTKVES